MDEKVTAYRKLKVEQDAVAGLQEKVKSLEAEVRRSINNSKKHEEQSVQYQNTIARRSEELKIANKEATTSRDQLQATIRDMVAQTKALKTAEDSLSIFRSFIVDLTPLGEARQSMYDEVNSANACVLEANTRYQI
jgi:chromosome segregation ATPase